MARFNRYEIAVHTNAVEHGGTNGDVFLSLVGEYETVRFFQVDNEEDNHEQGKTDVYFLERDYSIGNVKSVGVNLKFEGNDPTWSLGWIKVRHQYWYDRTPYQDANGGWVYGVESGVTTFHFDCYSAFNEDNITRSFSTKDYHEEEWRIPHNKAPGSGSGGPPPVKQKPNKGLAELVFAQPGWVEPTLYPAVGQDVVALRPTPYRSSTKGKRTRATWRSA